MRGERLSPPRAAPQHQAARRRRLAAGAQNRWRPGPSHLRLAAGRQGPAERLDRRGRTLQLARALRAGAERLGLLRRELHGPDRGALAGDDHGGAGHAADALELAGQADLCRREARAAAEDVAHEPADGLRVAHAGEGRAREEGQVAPQHCAELRRLLVHERGGRQRLALLRQLPQLHGQWPEHLDVQGQAREALLPQLLELGHGLGRGRVRGQLHGGPDGHHAQPVPAQHEAREVLPRHPDLRGDLAAEAHRLQEGAGADDALRVETRVHEGVDAELHGVGHHEHQGPGVLRRERRGVLVEDLEVRPRDLRLGLELLGQRRPGAHDDDVGLHLLQVQEDLKVGADLLVGVAELGAQADEHAGPLALPAAHELQRRGLDPCHPPQVRGEGRGDLPPHDA
mmetsp:Transcript_56796/g.182489  ORF Transcript_56796/g.182489 Transcript_56796/m.182489 type:complete len:399 (-) Transcript_56796:170-1366(-)